MAHRWIVGLTLLVAASGSADVAGAGHRQRVAGTVIVPTGEACGASSYPGALLYTGARVNGASHYFFDIEPTTRGHDFTLAADADAAADLDITFVGEGSARRFESRGPNETGTVPRWAESAWICAYAGAAVDFLYLAG